jgi:predicted O-methyltransferase YrrM
MKFTCDWFTPAGCPTIWPKHLAHLKGKPGLNALEIGCFEGRATVWLLENILTGSESTITCIDTFEGGQEHKELGVKMDEVERCFVENTEPFKDKVLLLKGRSDAWLPMLDYMLFDFIYIDGSHVAGDVLMDACLSWPILKPGGIMIFDDYEWNRHPEDPTQNPKMGINAFLALIEEQVVVLHKGYQVIISKM